MSASLHTQISIKAGDKYRIKKFQTRPLHWNSSGEMDAWMGKVVTIASFRGMDNMNGWFRIKEDIGWGWQKTDFEEIQESEWDT